MTDKPFNWNVNLTEVSEEAQRMTTVALLTSSYLSGVLVGSGIGYLLCFLSSLKDKT